MDKPFYFDAIVQQVDGIWSCQGITETKDDIKCGFKQSPFA
jgi:hypothetical protein